MIFKYRTLPSLPSSLNKNHWIVSQSSGKTLHRTFNIRFLYSVRSFNVYVRCLKCIILMMSFCSMKYDSILRKFSVLFSTRSYCAIWLLGRGGEHFPSMNGEYEWFILSVELLSRVITSTTSTRSQLRSSNATWSFSTIFSPVLAQAAPLSQR